MVEYGSNVLFMFLSAATHTDITQASHVVFWVTNRSSGPRIDSLQFHPYSRRIIPRYERISAYTRLRFSFLSRRFDLPHPRELFGQFLDPCVHYVASSGRFWERNTGVLANYIIVKRPVVGLVS